jgi:glycosyltransferase involved in cell wall biosynthesis
MRHLIVIPAFNEEEALPQTVARLQRLPAGFEILVVNDGSTDRTKDVANALVAASRLPLHVAHLPVNCGIGVAVQTGYRFAVIDGGYRYVIQFDADGQHDADYLSALVEQADREGLDLCVGSRFLRDFGPGSRSTFSRRIGIRFFAWLIGVMSGAKVTDPTSGFRCLGPRAWRRFADSYPEDYPEPESLFWCARNGLKVGELPVRMFERQGGVSSIRKLKAAYYMVKVSLAILFDRIRGSELARAVPQPTTA